MKEIKMNRSGKGQFGFVGEEIFTADTKQHDSVRWKQLRVCIEAKIPPKQKGGFYVGIGRLTIMKGEHKHFTIDHFTKREKVLAFVMNAFPEADLKQLTDVLYPPKKAEHGERREDPKDHQGDKPEQHQEDSTKVLS